MSRASEPLARSRDFVAFQPEKLDKKIEDLLVIIDN
jgi:hypothetical protein